MEWLQLLVFMSYKVISLTIKYSWVWYCVLYSVHYSHRNKLKCVIIVTKINDMFYRPSEAQICSTIQLGHICLMAAIRDIWHLLLVTLIPNGCMSNHFHEHSKHDMFIYSIFFQAMIINMCPKTAVKAMAIKHLQFSYKYVDNWAIISNTIQNIIFWCAVNYSYTPSFCKSLDVFIYVCILHSVSEVVNCITNTSYRFPCNSVFLP